MKKIGVALAIMALIVGSLLAPSTAMAGSHPKKCNKVYDAWMDAGIELTIGTSRSAEKLLKIAISLTKDSRTKSLMNKQRIGFQDGSYPRSIWTSIYGRLSNGYC